MTASPMPLCRTGFRTASSGGSNGDASNMPSVMKTAALAMEPITTQRQRRDSSVPLGNT